MSMAAPSSRRLWSVRALWVAVPLLQAGYQIAAKSIGHSLPKTASLLQAASDAIFSPWLALLILCEAASLYIWMFALSEIRLSAAFPMTAAGYVLVILAGWFLFGEHIDALAAAGSGVILLGVGLIGHEESHA